MKKLSFFLSALIVCYITVSSINSSNITDYNPIITRSGGPALILGADKTGGPVSSGTCTQCHGVGSANTTIEITVKDVNSLPVTEYIPGANYTMEFLVSNASLLSYGMQAVALNSSNAQAGTFGTPISPNTQVTGLSGREYVEHSSTVTNIGGFNYIVPWTAPISGSGNVDVYGMGIAVNGDFSTAGDVSSLPTSISLSEVIPTTISYSSINYCEDESNQTPTITGNQTGTFSSTGSLVISTSTGIIDVSNSPVGDYDVTYTYNGSLTTTTNVTINEIFNEVDNITICGNETYLFGSQTLTAADAGSNTEVFQSANGCDSTVVLSLTVLPNSFTSTITICENESYIFGTQTLTAVHAGLNTEIFPNAMTNGCDSVVDLTLIVNPNIFTQSATICNDGTYTFGSQTLTASDAGLNTEVFPNAMTNGCDSVINLTLSIQAIDNSITSSNNGVLMANQSGATYQWLDCDNGNLAITDSINQTYNADPGGSTPYNCAVEITLNGCSINSNCTEAIFFGINEYDTFSLTVYPIPANESITIEGLDKLTGIKSTYIMNINGENVLKVTDVNSPIIIDQLSKGVYYLMIEHKGGTEQLRIIKQ